MIQAIVCEYERELKEFLVMVRNDFQNWNKTIDEVTNEIERETVAIVWIRII